MSVDIAAMPAALGGLAAHEAAGRQGMAAGFQEASAQADFGRRRGAQLEDRAYKSSEDIAHAELGKSALGLPSDPNLVIRHYGPVLGHQMLASAAQRAEQARAMKTIELASKVPPQAGSMDDSQRAIVASQMTGAGLAGPPGARAAVPLAPGFIDAVVPPGPSDAALQAGVVGRISGVTGATGTQQAAAVPFVSVAHPKVAEPKPQPWNTSRDAGELAARTKLEVADKAARGKVAAAGIAAGARKYAADMSGLVDRAKTRAEMFQYLLDAPRKTKQSDRQAAYGVWQKNRAEQLSTTRSSIGAPDATAVQDAQDRADVQTLVQFGDPTATRALKAANGDLTAATQDLVQSGNLPSRLLTPYTFGMSPDPKDPTRLVQGIAPPGVDEMKKAMEYVDWKFPDAAKTTHIEASSGSVSGAQDAGAAATGAQQAAGGGVTVQQAPTRRPDPDLVLARTNASFREQKDEKGNPYDPLHIFKTRRQEWMDRYDQIEEQMMLEMNGGAQPGQ